MGTLAILVGIFGALSFIYYGIIVTYAGTASEFAWFWLMVGIMCIITCFLLYYMKKHELLLPPVIKYVAGGVICLGAVLFILIEGSIVYYSRKQPVDQGDYVIVLGAKVRGTKITNSLKKRLDKAAEYAMGNPNIKLIVSGGQGPGEDVTEAKAMKEYLILKGIPAVNIIEEGASRNTNENIINSKKIIQDRNIAEGKDITQTKIIVVTNGFHVYRAIHIGEKQGLSGIEGLAAPTDRILCLNYYVREVFAIVKDKIVGNI